MTERQWCEWSGEQFDPGVRNGHLAPYRLAIPGRIICPGCDRDLKLRDGLTLHWQMIPRHKTAA